MSLLDGKVGLIFGVANERSYAWHIARALLEHGAECAFGCLPGEKNEARTRLAIEALALDEPWIKPCNVASDEDLDDLFDAYGRDFQHLDFLIHSVAFADKEWLAPGKFPGTPRQDFLNAMDVSVYSLVAMAQRSVPLMAASGGGSILSMSYYGALKVVPGYNTMGVAKAALEAANRYLAFDLGPKKIRVNVISGGPLKTLAATGISGFRSMLAHAEARSPLGRNVEGREVGNTAVFLVSDLSSGVTGETIYVDCGINTMGM